MDRSNLYDLIEKALAGDPAAQAHLVATLTPVVQSRVARVLRRRAGAAGRDVRQEVEDLSQDVFLLLFAEGGKVLRTWQPERGLSLANFVGLVAERRTASVLRSGRRSPWRDDPTLPADLDLAAPESGPEEIVASREQLRILLCRLTEELSPLGRHLFDLLYERELEPADVAAQTGLSLDAVYQWRSRLRVLARRLLAETSESEPVRRSTSKSGGT